MRRRWDFTAKLIGSIIMLCGMINAATKNARSAFPEIIQSVVTIKRFQALSYGFKAIPSFLSILTIAQKTFNHSSGSL